MMNYDSADKFITEIEKTQSRGVALNLDINRYISEMKIKLTN